MTEYGKIVKIERTKYGDVPIREYLSDQYESVYRCSKEHHGYMFVGKLNGRTLKQFVHDLEEAEMYSQAAPWWL